MRLRWVLLILAAIVVWLTAVLTEPVRPGPPSAATADAPSQYRSTDRSITSSPEAASRFFRKLAVAVRTGLRTGRVELSITETEATSALDAVARLVELRAVMSTLSPEELEELDTPEEIRRALDRRAAAPPEGLPGRIRYALNPRLGFRQAQVRFRRDGRVVVSGYAQAWARRAPVYVDAIPALREGRVDLDVRETRLGRLEVPGWVLAGPVDLMGLVLGFGSDYATLERLSVDHGTMRLTGRVRPPRG